MLTQMYNERFPPGTRFGSPIPAPPEMVRPPPPPAGFFARLVDAFTSKSGREEKAAQDENNRRVAEHARALETAIAAGKPIDEMRGRLAEDTTVDENDLRALAQARAQRVRDYFATGGKIAPERLFLGKDKADPAKEAKGARVFLGLQ